MRDLQQLGWPTQFVGELDHRRLKVPSVKLRSARRGDADDSVFCVDLRVRAPNADDCLSSTELHSLERFLLEGLQRYLPQNFVSVGIMGCRTGFYLVFLNEGRARVICDALQHVVEEIQTATGVPYARVDQCGNWQDHSVARARSVAREILARRGDWLDAA